MAATLSSVLPIVPIEYQNAREDLRSTDDPWLILRTAKFLTKLGSDASRDTSKVVHYSRNTFACAVKHFSQNAFLFSVNLLRLSLFSGRQISDFPGL